ncbi:UDP-glycosyltransferase 83A1-like [Olea europaea subsp. europaea]|uniref:UDP-glycosyltransferase 83A1-like n=1 Tax=Olea europaea subsp. europaea TaxID=158383 RepID=A0A8S0QSH9_OLEEU|nr:UDP-glycosyltransferase 83A1-like [Olea europaea subsp. europaea]
MSDELMALIEQINGSESDKITCLIADATMGWALEVAEKMGIKYVAFWPPAATQLALLFKIPNFIDDRIIDSDAKIIFKLMVRILKPVKSAYRLICNSSKWLESGTFASFTDFIPIGPLLASNPLGKSAGNFWKEHSGCLAWLDQQPHNSVIYVAFGSLTIFDQNQFEELAIGLELTNRPFLWVVRETYMKTSTMHIPWVSTKECIIGGRW